MNALGSIANSPLIRLERLPGPGSADIWVKWEGANPTGSMKDRMALSMVEGAERRGELRPGGRVVEYTGGSTGSSLALVCAVKGYEAHFVSSDAFAEEKLRTMKAFGAQLDIVPSDGGRITPALVEELVTRAKRLAAEPDTFWPDQFNNADNRAGYHAMGREILDQTGDRLDAFVMGVGTGGCFSGNAEVLKDRLPEIKCIALEPQSSKQLSGGPLGGHRIEGIGTGFVTSITRMDLMDEIMAVSDEAARDTARRLVVAEGIFGGTSSGANVFAALKIAADLGPGHRVVTVVVDSGLKYLDGDLFS